MKSVKMQIAEIIKNRRMQLNMTQKQVAEMLGYESVQFFSMIERGLSSCPYQILGSLCVILNIPKDKFSSLILEEFKEQLSQSMDLGTKTMKAKRKIRAQ